MSVIYETFNPLDFHNHWTSTRLVLVDKGVKVAPSSMYREWCEIRNGVGLIITGSENRMMVIMYSEIRKARRREMEMESDEYMNRKQQEAEKKERLVYSSSSLSLSSSS